MTRPVQVLPLLGVALAFASGCPRSHDLPPLSKADVLGNPEPDYWCIEVGLKPGCDLCASYGWYGDGACDSEFVRHGVCRQPDPDCPEEPDGGPPDGGDGGDGDPGPVDPLRIGSGDTLEIATWNLRNFPTEITTPAKVAYLVARMDLDLVAVQEIASTTAFSSLLTELPTHAGLVSPDEYEPGNYQKTGFLYRQDMFTVQHTESLFVGDAYAFPRPPFRVDFEASLPAGSFTFIAIAAHLKAGVGSDDETRRRDACEQLKAYIDDVLGQGPESQVLLLGDLNDSIDDARDENVFNVFLDDPGDYRFLTRGVTDQGEYSYIPWQRLIDHILVTTDFTGGFQGDSGVVVHLHQADLGYDYESLVSDHLPVISLLPY